MVRTLGSSRRVDRQAGSYGHIVLLIQRQGHIRGCNQSSAFDRGEPIPTKHTGEGEDVSPALSWRDQPDGTRSYALICHDPDAPLVKPGTYGFVHWVQYGIPGSICELPEGDRDYIQGINDFGKPGYGGPMPPEGHGTHHYFFWLLALDVDADLEPGLTMSR